MATAQIAPWRTWNYQVDCGSGVLARDAAKCTMRCGSWTACGRRADTTPRAAGTAWAAGLLGASVHGNNHDNNNNNKQSPTQQHGFDAKD
jgi:hypothetical protein